MLTNLNAFLPLHCDMRDVKCFCSHSLAYTLNKFKGIPKYPCSLVSSLSLPSFFRDESSNLLPAAWISPRQDEVAPQPMSTADNTNCNIALYCLHWEHLLSWKDRTHPWKVEHWHSSFCFRWNFSPSFMMHSSLYFPQRFAYHLCK